ncbi:hypothetical protein NDU88_004808 [Pleurodeles waltl]|uniref:Uncharacterized protein n=1 Tax=Pleurodeles waltl TaxID=8319 RepID=A0AAV7QGK8_PLEWA|nr:hypothetical protein NDU88_004808 [Pleurodeles waltl]
MEKKCSREHIPLRETVTGKHSPSCNRADQLRQTIRKLHRQRQPCTHHTAAALPGNCPQNPATGSEEERSPPRPHQGGEKKGHAAHAYVRESKHLDN